MASLPGFHSRGPYSCSRILITSMAINWLPNYATIIGLFQVADTITRIIIQDPPAGAAIAESFNCGKLELTKYYSQSTFKWYGILTIFLTLEVIQLVPPILIKVASQYAKAADLIPWLLISRFFIGPIHFSDNVHKGCDKPEYAMYSLFVQMAFRAFFFWLFLSPKALPSIIDNYNYIGAYCIADLPSVLAKNVFAWWIVNKNLYKVKISWWQTIFSPLISIIPIIPINLAIVYGFHILSNGNFVLSVILAIIALLTIFFFGPLLLMFMLGLTGGFDERGLKHLHDAALLSGPMRWFVKGMFYLGKWGSAISPLKKFMLKYRIPHEAADKEADELNKMRDIV